MDSVHVFQANLRYGNSPKRWAGHGEYVTRAAEFRPALERAYQIAARDGRPPGVNCQGKKEFWNRAAHPPA